MFGNDGASPQFNTTSNTLTVAGTSYQLTTANSTASNGNDQNDSDATLASGSPVSAANGFPTISLTTPDAGANHTFDVGFVRQLATYSIAKTMDKKQVEKGQIVTYTVSLTNTSATTATNLVLTDQFSATATTLVGSATTSAGTFAPGASGGTWSLSSLAGGKALRSSSGRSSTKRAASTTPSRLPMARRPRYVPAYPPTCAPTRASSLT